MKHVVVNEKLYESDIRPAQIISQFMELSIREAAHYFANPAELIEVDCPACGSPERTLAFVKHEFKYQRCAECGSLYVSPRPSEARLAEYYAQSEASAFRVQQLVQATDESRRVHILRDNAYWLGRLIDEAGNPAARSFADLGTNYPALFEEIRRLELFDAFYSIEPLRQLDEAIRQRGAVVIEQAPECLMGALTAFEQIEHLFSPLEYLRAARQMLAGGGMIFITTRTISGFDLQVLWDRTPYIYVPEHLNLLSTTGIQRLFEQAELEVVELSTPGRLDLELVQRAAEADPSIPLSAFLRMLIQSRSQAMREDFQEFLQKHRLSSHVRVAALKKNELENA